MTETGDEYGYWRLDTDTCDLCGDEIEATDSPRVMPTANFGSEEDEISPQEAINAIEKAITRSGNEYDQRLAQALRDNQGYCAHQHCIDETSLYIGTMEEGHDG